MQASSSPVPKETPSQVVLATRNAGKVAEIKELLADLPIAVCPLDAFGCPDVVEAGETLQENAVKKATEVARRARLWALADDSGLEVDYLNGMPGVRSARFAGEEASDEDNNEKLLALLEGVPWEQRRARFRCVMALADPTGKYRIVEGLCEGVITTSRAGTGGFGYDSLFFFPPLGRTFAQLDTQEKSRVSHRGQALRRLRKLLVKGLEGGTGSWR